jgi:hypothetical protein
VSADGTKYWYLNGKYHRENRPAIEYSNGTKEWFVNGRQHREDGPAVEYTNGSKQWFIDGKNLKTQSGFERELKKMGLKKESKGFLLKDLASILNHPLKY